MKAITVEPRKPETARLEEIPEPDVRDGSVLVEAIAVGVCGTDVEIVEGKYGWAPQGRTRLVLGHAPCGVGLPRPEDRVHLVVGRPLARRSVAPGDGIRGCHPFGVALRVAEQLEDLLRGRRHDG